MSVGCTWSWCQGAVVLCAVVAAACSPSSNDVPPPKPAPPPVVAPAPASYADGVAALRRGDVINAVALLQQVPSTDPDYRKSLEALIKARAEADAVRDAWLRQIDRLLRQRRLQAARAHTEHMLEQFPLDDVARPVVEARLLAIDQARVAALADIEVLDEQTSELLEREDWVGALRAMRQAQGLAREVLPDTVLVRGRVISATEVRAAKLGLAAKPEPAGKDKDKDKESKAQRNGGQRRKAAGGKEAEAPAQTQTQTQTEPDEESSEPKVHDLLRSAAGFQQSKAYFNAIVAYLQVRELDPTNESAKIALDALDAKRRELVDEYLRIANDYFLKQDLASAVPYFRRVLLLDKSNEAAIKGLQMHYNLERIQRERRRK